MRAPGEGGEEGGREATRREETRTGVFFMLVRVCVCVGVGVTLRVCKMRSKRQHTSGAWWGGHEVRKHNMDGFK